MTHALRISDGATATPAGHEDSAIRQINLGKGKPPGQSDNAPTAVSNLPVGSNDNADPSPDPSTVLTTPPAVATLTQADIDSALAPLQQRLTDATAQIQALVGIFNRNPGNPNPVSRSGDAAPPAVRNLNAPLLVSSLGDQVFGAAKEFETVMRDSTVVREFRDDRGRLLKVRDNRDLWQFVKGERKHVRADMWRAFKASISTGSDASTSRANIADTVLAYLSLVLERDTHSARFIWWQFVNKKIELGKKKGDTIQVLRWNYLPEPGAVADRRLVPGTRITSTLQNLAETSVSITLNENGLGLDASNPPLAVPEFWMANSMWELEGVVQRNLGHDWMAFTDLEIRGLYGGTTRIYYNDNGLPTVTPGDVGTNDGGQCTRGFLINLFAQMQSDKIPTYSNGMYALVLPPNPLAQLKDDLNDQDRFVSKQSMADLTNAINMTAGGERDMVSGYIFDCEGFMIFSSNSSGIGAAGTENVQNATLGTGVTLTRSGYAFGAGCVGEGEGMPVQIRMNKDDDYGRSNEFIWVEHNGRGYLDMDPALNASQQLRCYEVRFTDVFQ